VGHETDFSISDFTADLRVPTPSAAAELVIGRREEFIEKIENLRKIMLSEVKLQMEYTSGRFKSASESYVFREPAYMLREKQQTLDGFQGRMDGAAKDLADKYSARLNRAKTRFMYESSGEIKRSGEKIRELERTMTACLDRSLERNTASVFNLDAKLSALNPLSVLKRGYSVTIDAETGKHVSDPELPAGKKLKTLVSGGVIESEVVSGHSQSVSDSIKEAF
jgi:exodeoxyribonuclease VII large subunit